MTSSEGKALDAHPERKSADAKLTGAPKLAFLQNPNGDTITRKTGRWDGDDGFVVGQTITITGAMNAGTFIVSGISDDGATVVLDARQVVTEMVTSALSITGTSAPPPVESSTRNKIDPDSENGGIGTPLKESPTRRDKNPASNKQVTGVAAKSPTAKRDGIRADGKKKIEISPIDGDDDPEANRVVTDAPGRAIRSGTEITKMLQSICDEGLPVTAYPEDGEQLFVSKVRGVDADLSRLVLDYSQWKPANSAVLACEEVLFHSERKNRHIQFLAENPSEIVFAGSAGIQVAFPQFVLDLQQRSHRRINVKYLPSLWCVIKVEGANSIVANVTDISRGGIGGVVHDLGVKLKPGTIIRDCQITGSSLKRPIDVSVEVRHWKTVRAKDGTLSKQVGCRFVTSPEKLQEMIKAFEADLDGQ